MSNAPCYGYSMKNTPNGEVTEYHVYGRVGGMRGERYIGSVEVPEGIEPKAAVERAMRATYQRVAVTRIESEDAN